MQWLGKKMVFFVLYNCNACIISVLIIYINIKLFSLSLEVQNWTLDSGLNSKLDILD